VRETETIIGKAPRLGIHTRQCLCSGQAGIDATLRGIFRGHIFTKFADTLCGGCECVVEGGCMQGRCVGGRIGVMSRRYMEEVRVSTKSNRVGAAARQSPPCAQD